MATEVLLPKLGMNTEFATIVAWRKREGDLIAVGEVLADVETDKAIVELEADTAGTLRRLLATDGDRVAVNQPIAILGAAQEDITALEARLAAGTPAQEAHVERVYEAWTGNGHAPSSPTPATNGVAPQASPPTTPAAPRRIPRPGALDPDAIRARLAARGSLGATNGAAAHTAAATNGSSNGVGKNVAGSNGHATITLLPPMQTAPAQTRLVIYGAGLGAKQLLEVTRQLDTIVVVGLIDDKPGLAGTEIGGVPVLGGFAALASLATSGAIDGVALSFHSEIRQKVHRRIRNEVGLRILPLVDPRAHIGADVTIGDGALIEAGAVVGPGTTVGEGAIVDVGAIVAHDCFLGPFSHLSPGCALSGVVCLRENVLVGVGAAINSTVTVGRNVIITPGAAVMNDLPDDVIVGGVPAKILGASKRGA